MGSVPCDTVELIVKGCGDALEKELIAHREERERCEYSACIRHGGGALWLNTTTVSKQFQTEIDKLVFWGGGIDQHKAVPS